MPAQKRKKALIYLGLTTLIWGSAASVIKVGLNDMPTFTYLFLRFLISSITLLPFFIIHVKRSPLKSGSLPILFLTGFTGIFLSLGLLFLGIDKTSALDSSIIASSSPLIISIAGVIFLKEVITKQEKIGTVIAFVGMLIIILEPWKSGVSGSEGKERLWGNVLIFGFVVSYTIYTIITREYLNKRNKHNPVTPFAKVAVEFFIATILFFPLAAYEMSNITSNPNKSLYAKSMEFSPSGTVLKVSESNQAGYFSFADMFSKKAMLSLFYMSLISGVLGYYLYESALQNIEASESSIFTYLQPLVGVPLSFVLLGEIATPVFLSGCAVIGIGVYLAESRKKIFN